MLGGDVPIFQTYTTTPSSDHPEYHKRAIQVYSRAKFEGRTAHQDDYCAWELPKALPVAAEEQTRKHLPFTATSTYSELFKEHQLSELTHPQPGTFPPKGTVGKSIKFNATSSYSQDFVAKDLPMTQPCIPSQKPHSSAKFTGTSIYTEDFHAHPLDQHQLTHTVPKTTFMSRPFEASTVYKDTFVPHKLEAREAAAVAHAPRKAQRFDGSTTHNDAFKAWELPSKRGTLGVATVGDRLHVLIPAQLPSPASTQQTFTTVRDGQREMCVMVYEGSNPTASKNKLLGQFQLVNIPLAAVGEPKLKVTFHLDGNNVLRVEAVDAKSSAQHVWRMGDGQPTLQAAAPSLAKKQDCLPANAAIAVCA